MVMVSVDKWELLAGFYQTPHSVQGENKLQYKTMTTQELAVTISLKQNQCYVSHTSQKEVCDMKP